MTSYQPGIPTGLVNLDVDYQNIQGNFTQLNTSFSVDHIPLTQVAQNGYHTSVHMNPVSTTATNPPNNYPPTQPATTAGFGQAYSAQINDGLSTDQALFFLTGGGKNLQLTSNVTPLAATNGYTFLPGGILIQWGLKTGISSSGTVNFLADGNINFTSDIFSVVCTLGPTSTPVTNSGSISTFNTSTTGFSYAFFGSGYNRFRWIAIGK